MKALGLTEDLHGILFGLSSGEESGIPGVAVKCVDIRRNTSGDAAFWTDTDAEARKPGEQTGLDTPVVLAVNDDRWVWGVFTPSVPKLTH